MTNDNRDIISMAIGSAEAIGHTLAGEGVETRHASRYMMDNYNQVLRVLKASLPENAQTLLPAELGKDDPATTRDIAAMCNSMATVAKLAIGQKGENGSSSQQQAKSNYPKSQVVSSRTL